MDDSSANIDQQLLNAYQQTVYQILEPPIAIKIGEANPVLNAFLREQNAFSWAFITAWNPKSEVQSFEENNLRHQELVEMIQNSGYAYFLGKGIGQDVNWEPEVSLFMLDISESAARHLGHHFEQNAIVFGNHAGVPQLIWL